MCFEASGDLLIQMQNISCKVQACKETKTLRLVFGFESDTAVLPFTFCFLFSPLYLLFLPQSFPFAGYLVGFISLGNNKHPAISKLVTFIASFFIKYMYINVVTACEQYSFLSTLLVARDILQPERHQVQPKKLYADVMMIICLESGQY